MVGSYMFLTLLLFLATSLVSNGDTDPSGCMESEMREACRGEYQKKHAFFMFPDRWTDTMNFKNSDLVRCLDAKPRWIHFAGDSTSRMLFAEILSNYYNISMSYFQNGIPHEVNSKPTKISWIFKGKFMRSYTNVPYDVNNEMFRNMSETNHYPDILFISVGPHELMAWSGRRSPVLSVDAFKKDTDDFLDLLQNWSFFNNSKTAVYFGNMNALRGWRHSLEEMSKLRNYACEQQKYACKAFRARGARILDMFGISDARPDLSDKAGVHYGPPVVTEQVKALVYDFCKREGLA